MIALLLLLLITGRSSGSDQPGGPWHSLARIDQGGGLPKAPGPRASGRPNIAAGKPETDCWTRQALWGLVATALQQPISPPEDSPAEVQLQPQPVAIDEVLLQGTIDHTLADLRLILRIDLDESGPATIPIGLSKQVLLEVTERGLDLPVTTTRDGSWAVRLSEARTHEIQVHIRVPLQIRKEGWSTELAIPPASSTRIDLQTLDPVEKAALNGDQALNVQPGERGPSRRITGWVGPQNQIRLTAEVAPASSRTPVLLSSQVETLAEIGGSGLTLRRNVQIQCEQAAADFIEFGTDSSEQLISCQLDGRPVEPVRLPNDSDTGRTLAKFQIPLPKALASDASCTLTLTTRMLFSGEGPWQVELHGLSLMAAASQTGVLALACSIDRTVQTTSQASLMRIGLETLPPSLGSLPAVIEAYRFQDQQFQLGLKISALATQLRVRTQTTISLSESSVDQVAATFDYEVQGPAIPSIQVEIPEALTLTGIGPPETVLTSRQLSSPQGASRRLLEIELTASARRSGRFPVQLRAQQPSSAGDRISVERFLPRADRIQGSIAILGGPRQGFRLEKSAVFPGLPGEPPASWVWPSGLTPSRGSSVLWVEDYGQPSALQLVRQPLRSHLSIQSAIELHPTATEIAWSQESEVHATSGELERLTFEVPAELEPTLQIDAGDHWTPQRLGAGSRGGMILYQLHARSASADPSRFQFRAVLTPAKPISETPVPIVIPQIQWDEASSLTATVRIASDARTQLRPLDSSWSRVRPQASDRDPVGSSGHGFDSFETRITSRPSRPLQIAAQRREPVAMPDYLVDCLWIRCFPTAGDGQWTAAELWIETDRPDLGVIIPPHARWQRVRVDDETIAQVESLGSPGGYRIPLPAQAKSRRHRILLEYQVPAGASSEFWIPPRLSGDAWVQRTYLEVNLPGDQAVVSAPAGWTDENTWAWRENRWCRMPRVERPDWHARPSRTLNPQDPASPESEFLPSFPAGSTVLFSAVGAPLALQPWIVHRTPVAAVTLGLTLCLGLLVLFAPPRVRYLLLKASGFGLAALTWSSAPLVAMGLPTACFGAALVGVVWLTKRLGDQGWPRNANESVDQRPQAAGEMDLASSTVTQFQPGLQPDVSTVIRPRPVAPGPSSYAVAASTTAQHSTSLQPVSNLNPAGDEIDHE